jgi:hypothetical protein
MSEARPFCVDAQQHPKLASLYSLLPELPEVFGNIVQQRPLIQNVLSFLDTPTLLDAVENLVVPVLLEYEVCSHDKNSPSGLSTPYSFLQFAGLGRKANAEVSARRAAHIASSIEDSDTKEDALSVSWNFDCLPHAARREFFHSLRSLVTSFSNLEATEPPHGRPLRVVILGR